MIRVASLRGFPALVEDLGGDPGPMLLRFGIDPDVFRDEDGLIPITAHDRMLDAAARDLDCPDLGLRLAASQDLSILGPLAVAIETSSTAAEALDCASQFLFVHSPALRIGAEEDPLSRRGVIALAYRKDLLESTYSPQGMELGLGVFFRMIVSMIGDVRGLRSVLFPHQPLSPVQRYLDFFGADVRFGSRVAALCVQSHMLEEDFASANATIRSVAIEHLSGQRDPRLDLPAQVRAAIAEALRTSQPTLASVARSLATHPRTLQRRLSARQTSFAELLDEVRREATHRYLTTTDLPVGQIALMVGFGAPSTLVHATRRWYGVTPRELRATGYASRAGKVQG